MSTDITGGLSMKVNTKSEQRGVLQMILLSGPERNSNIVAIDNPRGFRENENTDTSRKRVLAFPHP